ncbi:MAG: hypothetical protein R3B13_33590 [Polyangiaceae bacterium]
MHLGSHSGFVVGAAILVVAGCGADEERRPVVRPFVMVDGDEVFYTTPRTHLNVDRRAEGLIVAPTTMLRLAILTCTQLSQGACVVETCTYGADTSEYGIASVEMKSGSNEYSAFGTETDVKPADFWQPGAPIAIRLSASEAPSVAPFADAVVTGPPPLELLSPNLAPSLKGRPGAHAFDLPADREFVASWSPIAGSTVLLSLACTNDVSHRLWWAEVRCEVRSEIGEVHIPRELIDFLPGRQCNFALATRAAETVTISGHLFEFDVRRRSQTADGIEAVAEVKLR